MTFDGPLRSNLGSEARSLTVQLLIYQVWPGPPAVAAVVCLVGSSRSIPPLSANGHEKDPKFNKHRRHPFRAEVNKPLDDRRTVRRRRLAGSKGISMAWGEKSLIRSPAISRLALWPASLLLGLPAPGIPSSGMLRILGPPHQRLAILEECVDSTVRHPCVCLCGFGGGEVLPFRCTTVIYKLCYTCIQLKHMFPCV